LQAPDAEALMRSRYSAFVLGLADYLLDTWHPRTRPAPPLVLDPAVHWLGLDVRSQQRQDGAHATVEFVARSKQAGKTQAGKTVQAGRATRLHERSRFVREGGLWLYLDGEML
jgi:SEC-C motif-containing protein